LAFIAPTASRVDIAIAIALAAFLVIHRRQFTIAPFLAVFTSCCLPFFFYLFWLIMVHHLLLHPLPCSLRISPSVSAFLST
jgi:hypothetical protein